jgi:hypothetical protein
VNQLAIDSPWSAQDNHGITQTNKKTDSRIDPSWLASLARNSARVTSESS